MKQVLLMIAMVALVALVALVGCGTTPKGAMQDQDEIIARAIRTDKVGNGKVASLHLELRQDTKGSGLITDVGLGKVAAREELKQLFLSGTKITDEGLGHVANLRHLRRLTLNGCLGPDAVAWRCRK
jgi:hypothetical protein